MEAACSGSIRRTSLPSSGTCARNSIPSAMGAYLPVRGIELEQEAGEIKDLADVLDVSLPDTERLDFVIEKNMPLQQSAEGFYVQDIGFFATGREAIDAAMRKEKEK